MRWSAKITQVTLCVSLMSHFCSRFLLLKFTIFSVFVSISFLGIFSPTVCRACFMSTRGIGTDVATGTSISMVAQEAFVLII